MYYKTRICKECNNKIEYKTYGTYYQAEKGNYKCRSCASKENVKKYQGGMKGKNNPFYNKTHSKETRKVLSERDTTGWDMARDVKGKKNPMYGKIVYDIWVEKYGEKEAKIKDLKRRKKISKSNSGINNPMYGKPTPKGAGMGQGGWYNCFYFRSLRELKYILYMEENKIQWKSAERKIYRVPYKDFNGNDRTYSPDFLLINEKIIVECKPKRLQKTPLNKLKSKMAILFFKKMGIKYKMIDPGKIEQDILDNLIKDGKVKLIKRKKIKC